MINMLPVNKYINEHFFKKKKSAEKEDMWFYQEVSCNFSEGSEFFWRWLRKCLCLVSCCLVVLMRFNPVGENSLGCPEGVRTDGGGGGFRKGNVRKLEVTAIVGRCERQREEEEGGPRSAPCPARKRDLLRRTFTSFFLPPPSSPTPSPPIRQTLTSIKGPHGNTGSI